MAVLQSKHATSTDCYVQAYDKLVFKEKVKSATVRSSKTSKISLGRNVKDTNHIKIQDVIAQLNWPYGIKRLL